ncbi:DUF2147 domain-containing protein [Oceaniradius stylonematis]|uniref:DUF2147 domain-containing protein n=1 Tax=Oceaniradius stylonematis TaxID=2184161 RepID=A0A3A8ABL8_9HYPH|nr:DUF2147 domain-containing protein [Oceaniradius stylonematis]RKF06728.1 DUF2147 domain-containing protein [Oceaniradius stylonematis]
MKTSLLALAVAVTMTATPALADAIVGTWRTGSGETARIAECGSAFCITLQTGTYAGQQIGRVSLSGNRYVGNITDPAEGRQYKGRARLSGNTLNMTGCFGVCTPITSRTEAWKRQ